MPLALIAVGSGLRKLLIGVEAGSERMLKRLGKDITLEQIEEVAQRCRETDISATYPFIYGLPGETPEDLQALARWRCRRSFFLCLPTRKGHD
jgi:radical SAM superfamily enzyme YgiQ (UPF0313 family)